MTKKMFVILFVVSLMVVSAAMAGCTTTSNTTGTATPAASSAAPTATATPAKDGVTTSDGVTTISGSSGGKFPVHMEEGNYLLKFRYKGTDSGFNVKPVSSSGMSVPLMTSGAMGATGDGWSQMSRVNHWYSTDDETWEITAKAPYVVEIITLPMAGNPDSTPKTYTGNGWTAMGPISLKAGTATVHAKTDDTHSAGFMLSLMDSSTGNSAGSILDNLNGGSLSKTVDKTAQVTVPQDGVYFLELNTNGLTSWEVSVSQ